MSEPTTAETHAQQATRPRWLPPLMGACAVILLGGAGVYFRDPLVSVFATPAPNIMPQPADPVTVVDPNCIGVKLGSPLERRLQHAMVKLDDLEYPLLNVTGYVMARLAPGKDHAESRWDFASPEVATGYADWLNTQADVLVYRTQAAKTRELVKVRVEFLKNELARKEKNPTVIPERDLVAAKADYLQADIQGQKDITEAEANLKKAERNGGLLERQLLQSGVDPEVVRRAQEGLVLIVADVPEAKIGLVKVGQPCETSFYGVAEEIFKGRVGRLGPSVAKEKRTLRVTFELTNPSGRLLPGMFANIGLGTKSRRVLTVPTEAVLHAGESDYVLKEESPGKYRVVAVKVEEPRSGDSKSESLSRTPVLEGRLTEDDRVVGAGSILLKPIMVKALASGSAP